MASTFYIQNLFTRGIKRCAEVAGLFRLRPYDTATPEGRSKERLRRITLTAAASAFARIVSMGAPLVTVPLVLHDLGPERYGLWMAVTSITGMFVFADLGLGNGLLTAVSGAHGRDDYAEIRRCVSSAFFVLCVSAALMSLAFFAVQPFVPWQKVLKISSADMLNDCGTVLAITMAGFFASVPLGVVQRIQLGLQEGYQSNLWQCGASLLNLLLILTAVRLKASLPELVLCSTIVQPIIALLNGAVYFGRQHPQFMPRWGDFHWLTARRLLKQGVGFFSVSALMALGISSDNLVVASQLGLHAVALLSVPAKVTAILGTVASMVYMPLWAANGEAMARGDVDWVRRNTYRVIKINLTLVTLAGLFFVLAGPIVLRLWVGSAVCPGLSVFLSLACWLLVTSTANPLFMVLNARGLIVEQVKLYAVFAAISIPLKFALASRWGVAGVVWASVMAYALIVLPYVWWRVARLLAVAAQTTGPHNRPGHLPPK